MTTVTQVERELIEAIINDYHTTRLGSDYVPHILSKPRTQKALAAHREAAFEAGARKMQERAKRIIEKRMDDRFEEHGTREWDTNATYYQGSMAETYEELDQEDEAIRDAIAALDPAQIAGEKK